MNRTTIEYVLNAMYIALVSAGNMTDHQRAVANDTLFRCSGFDCAPPFAPEILRRIAANAVQQEAIFDDPPPAAPTRPRLHVVHGGA